jgi:gluconolactonase
MFGNFERCPRKPQGFRSAHGLTARWNSVLAWSLWCGVAGLIGLAETASAQDMQLHEILIEGEGWTLVGEGYKFTEGPVADATGRVYFTDVGGSKIYRLDAEGKPAVFVDDAGNPSGLKFGPGGKLYCCQYNRKRVVTYDPAAADAKASETVLASEIPVNDLVVTKAGGVYVTAPANKQVVYISPSGEKRVVAEGITTNGAVLWANEGTLVVTEGNEPILWTFRIEPDGSLTARDRYYGPLQVPAGLDKPGSDGMTVDTIGRLYVATHAGVQVFDPTGRHAGTISKPQRAFLSNVCFGGPNRDVLYVTTADKVFKRTVKATGLK